MAPCSYEYRNICLVGAYARFAIDVHLKNRTNESNKVRVTAQDVDKRSINIL
jgi:hypothetical protein